MDIWSEYAARLRLFEESGVIRLPVIPDYANIMLIFFILFQEQNVNKVMKQLQEAGIHAVFIISLCIIHDRK